MEDFLTKFALEHFGPFVVLFILFAVFVIWAVWNTAFLWFKFRNKTEVIDELKQKSFDKNELPCEKHDKTLEELKQKSFEKTELPCKEHAEKIEDHSLSLRALEVSVESMNKSIDRLTTSFNIALTQQHSPLSISKKGMEFVKRLGMDRMFENNWSRIKPMIEAGVGSKNPYDINEYCIKYAMVYPEKFLQPEEIDALKEDAYAEGFLLVDYMRVIAVMARDRYFKEENIKVKKTEPVAQ